MIRPEYAKLCSFSLSLEYAVRIYKSSGLMSDISVKIIDWEGLKQLSTTQLDSLKEELEWFEDVPLLEFMYLAFIRMQGESYRRRLRSLLLYLWYVFRALINHLVCSLRSLLLYLCYVYLWWSLFTLYLHSCQVRVTVGDSGLCCCICGTYFER